MIERKQYATFVCSECGEEATNSYSEPYFTDMVAKQLCFTCLFWEYEDQKLAKDHARMTIIGGCIYGPGSRTSGSFRGMAGRRFDIEYIAPSIFAGRRITTFDLWAGGVMPEKLRAKWPDTAKFLNGAERADLGKGGIYEAAWNPSQSRDEPHPLPCTLDLA